MFGDNVSRIAHCLIVAEAVLVNKRSSAIILPSQIGDNELRHSLFDSFCYFKGYK